MNQAQAQTNSQAGMNKELLYPWLIQDKHHQPGATLPRSGILQNLLWVEESYP